ncbi:uncharacterized protein SPSK_10012 [Sporothrix schenckii 1099-18]|uniref:Uncharacterized protein n=1 Tax=Sporothrix schenckii 1099-18 TaxID=1397361 RepID=A0A0F2MA59_SPOSC|nr:uncharacterized protein SPSK_10012 [Sporothrix schenckii 1099-18]KJR85959.1 hypothetical protein SPSK_10012 [Sporothrix schenckii 1099-18]
MGKTMQTKVGEEQRQKKGRDQRKHDRGEGKDADFMDNEERGRRTTTQEREGESKEHGMTASVTFPKQRTQDHLHDDGQRRVHVETGAGDPRTRGEARPQTKVDLTPGDVALPRTRKRGEWVKLDEVAR